MLMYNISAASGLPKGYPLPVVTGEGPAAEERGNATYSALVY